jgi:hypothetical protein
MPPMFVVETKMNTLKQHGKGTMFVKGSPISHNFLKITTWETLLKIFLTSTYITTQSGCNEEGLNAKRSHNL